MLYKLRWAQEMQGVLGGRPDFKELLDPTTPEWKERVRKLREVYKMDPKIVQQVDEEYGPFDWRLPDAHAVYWAELGRIHGRPEEQETLRRSIYQSLQAMGIRGGALDKLGDEHDGAEFHSLAQSGPDSSHQQPLTEKMIAEENQ